MKKYFASFVFLVLFGGYAVLEYLNGNSAAYAAPAVTASVPTTATQLVPSNTTSAQAAPPPSQEDQTDSGSDDSSETQSTQTAATLPAPAQTPAPTPTPAQTQPTQTVQPQGQYVDGTYTGPAENAFYGYVQVQATISGGKLANVTFLQYPNDRSTSRFINQQAMPILISEAVQAQNAQVNGVSGASDTSAAFVQSLGSALAQAKA